MAKEYLTNTSQKTFARKRGLFGVTLQSKGGFTLIELLVVISIIGLLSSVIILAVSRSRASARDARRIADIKAIKTAIELYIQQNGSAPIPATYGRSNVSPGFWDGWWDLSSNTSSGSFLSFLSTSGVMAKVPVDPLNTPNSFNGQPNNTGYRYFYYVVNGAYGYNGGTCDPGGNVYMLGIANLETDSAHPSTKFQDGSCSCIWVNTPEFFKSYFSYTTCGTF
jgi:prepilin-type N-terminal cleavage/methylation domain-containing protein